MGPLSGATTMGKSPVRRVRRALYDLVGLLIGHLPMELRARLMLFTSVALVVALPVLPGLPGGVPLGRVLMLLQLLASMDFIYGLPRRRPLATRLVLVGGLLALLVSAVDLHLVQRLSPLPQILFAIYFCLVTGVLIRVLLRLPQVTRQVLWVAMSGYLMLVISGGFLGAILEYFQPSSFHLERTLPELHNLPALVYYSFITISSVGFGDIYPLSPLARGLTVLLGAAGVFYSTLVLAILLGRYHSDNSMDD